MNRTPTLILRRCSRPGFTLIELLVVVAVVALLISILLPSLSRARSQSRVTVCLSNLHEIGLGIQSYAMQYNDAIPRGPTEPAPFDLMATNQVWLGETFTEYGPLGIYKNQGLGDLLDVDMRDPRVLYCPADDTNDPEEELEKVERRGEDDAYCSYFYRQRDQTTRDRLDHLGVNDLGLEARALVFDANSIGEGDYRRTNHEARRVNILYLDSHAQTVENERNVFSLLAEDLFGYEAIERRLNEILVAADFAESNDPSKTPSLDEIEP